MKPLHIVLTALDGALLEGWQYYASDLEFVTTYHGSILDLELDAVVSPANSFGYMDGGIDLVYSRHFGWDVQRTLQDRIEKVHHGELLVGQADIVPTENAAIPYLFSAPTMRVPMILRNSINAYLAARAVLLLWKYGTLPGTDTPVRDVIKTIGFPGLGTGVGKMGVNTCAHQVRTAIDEVVLGKRRFPSTWAEASQRHQLLYRDFTRDLQDGF
ncbi:MAG: macro domain-containing protein [Bacteroidota bacterium]